MDGRKRVVKMIVVLSGSFPGKIYAGKDKFAMFDKSKDIEQFE